MAAAAAAPTTPLGQLEQEFLVGQDDRNNTVESFVNLIRKLLSTVLKIVQTNHRVSLADVLSPKAALANEYYSVVDYMYLHLGGPLVLENPLFINNHFDMERPVQLQLWMFCRFMQEFAALGRSRSLKTVDPTTSLFVFKQDVFRKWGSGPPTIVTDVWNMRKLRLSDQNVELHLDSPELFDVFFERKTLQQLYAAAGKESSKSAWDFASDLLLTYDPDEQTFTSVERFLVTPVDVEGDIPAAQPFLALLFQGATGHPNLLKGYNFRGVHWTWKEFVKETPTKFQHAQFESVVGPTMGGRSRAWFLAQLTNFHDAHFRQQSRGRGKSVELYLRQLITFFLAVRTLYVGQAFTDGAVPFHRALKQHGRVATQFGSQMTSQAGAVVQFCQGLNDAVARLEDENATLRGDNGRLRRRMDEMADANALLRAEIAAAAAPPSEISPLFQWGSSPAAVSPAATALPRRIRHRSPTPAEPLSPTQPGAEWAVCPNPACRFVYECTCQTQAESGRWSPGEKPASLQLNRIPYAWKGYCEACRQPLKCRCRAYHRFCEMDPSLVRVSSTEEDDDDGEELE